MNKEELWMISGANGQTASYMIELLLRKGHKVIGLIRRSSVPSTERIDHLFGNPNFIRRYWDLDDCASIYSLLKEYQPDYFLNFAAQSHVKVSFLVPQNTSNVVALGAMKVLDAIKLLSPHTKFFQASSSEMFGSNQKMPLNENSLMLPNSPYACAKLFSYHITRIYRESYGIFACSGIMFNNECFFYDTPVIIKYKNNMIDIVYISSLVKGRKIIKHDEEYFTKDYSDSEIKVWDGESFVKLLSVSRKKLFGLEDENRKRVINNIRHGCVSTTPNHKLVTLSNIKKQSKDCIVNIESLKTGQYPIDHINNKMFTPEFCKLVGLLCGDGYISHSGIRLINSNNDIIEEFKQLCFYCFGNVKFITKEYKSGFNGKTVNTNVSGISSSIISLLREQIYEKKTKHKKVPTFVLNSSNENKYNFLIGYYLADGLKRDKTVYEFKSFCSNSALLVQGILYLINCLTKQDFNVGLYVKNNKYYFKINLLSNSNNGKTKGENNIFYKDRNILFRKQELNEKNQHVYDIETESGVVMAGVGKMVVGNSPRRTPTFVTRKITSGAAQIKLGLLDYIVLGNLEAKRDWTFSGDTVKAIYLMMKQNKPKDYVISSDVNYSIKDFLNLTFEYAGLGDYKNYVKIDSKYFRPNEVLELLGDSTLIRNELGWKPEISLKELVEMMYKHDYNIYKTIIDTGIKKWELSV